MCDRKTLTTVLWIVTCWTNCGLAQNVIFEQLVSRGVECSPTETLRLPAPALQPGLNAADQRRALESLLNGRYAWAEFTRRAVVAPFLLKISGDEAGKRQVGRRVDLWFVAYGSLQMLADDEFLSNQLKALDGDGAENGGRAKLLSTADLATRGIRLTGQIGDPRYVAAELAILDRVRVSVTTCNVKSTTPETLLVASLLAPQFAEDAVYPNRWRSIARDDQGRRQLGESQPYRGLGSYVQATQLVEPAGGLLVEYHLAFAEPEGWFHGANLLRSKLPIVAQDAVRKFRRSLDKK